MALAMAQPFGFMVGAGDCGRFIHVDIKGDRVSTERGANSGGAAFFRAHGFVLTTGAG